MRFPLTMAAIAVGVVAAMVACASAASPPSESEPEGSLPREPSVYALFGERAQLKLTSEQIAALDSIGAALISANAPLQQELQDLGVIDQFWLPSGLRTAVPREARQIMARLRKNNGAAAVSIGRVLTEEQRSLACEGQSRIDLQPIPPVLGQPMRRVPGDGQDPRRQLPWPWCTPPTTAGE